MDSVRRLQLYWCWSWSRLRRQHVVHIACHGIVAHAHTDTNGLTREHDSGDFVQERYCTVNAHRTQRWREVRATLRYAGTFPCVLRGWRPLRNGEEGSAARPKSERDWVRIRTPVALCAQLWELWVWLICG